MTEQQQSVKKCNFILPTVNMSRHGLSNSKRKFIPFTRAKTCQRRSHEGSDLILVHQSYVRYMRHSLENEPRNDALQHRPMLQRGAVYQHIITVHYSVISLRSLIVRSVELRRPSSTSSVSLARRLVRKSARSPGSVLAWRAWSWTPWCRPARWWV